MGRKVKPLTPETAYTGSLGRYAESQKQALDKLTQAETGYGELAQIYAPGGTYGAGQIATIEREKARGVATAQAGAVASGMSSGSMAQGLGARATREATQAKLGVEDVRADKYAGVLQGLASLRMASAGQMGSMAANEPSYAPFAGAYTSMYSTDKSVEAQKYSANLGYQGQMNASNLAAQSQQTIAKMQIDAEERMQQAKLGANVGYGSDAEVGKAW